MSDSFDPYHKWLGISPKDQPPHHYRLLGIDLFESDPDVINTASSQRMMHVKTFQIGKHSALSQKLLNEIAGATVCLLNTEKKRVYDAALRAKLDVGPITQSPPLPRPFTSPPDPTADSTGELQLELDLSSLSVPPPMPRMPRAARSSSPVIWLVATLICVALAGAAGFIFLSGLDSVATVGKSTVAERPGPDTSPWGGRAEKKRFAPPSSDRSFEPNRQPDGADKPLESATPRNPETPVAGALESGQPENGPKPDAAGSVPDQPARTFKTEEELAKALGQADTVPAWRAMTEDALDSLDSAIVKEQRDTAHRIAILALRAARKADEPQLIRKVTRRFLDVQKPIDATTREEARKRLGG